jgi:hypothetical protein
MAMMGQIPITAVLALLAAGVLLLVLAYGSRSRATRAVARSFWCGLRGRNVTAQFEEKAWDGKRLEVTSCTAFTPPTDVRCDQACLALDKLPRARKPRAA